ncbi:MAG: HD domain-containing protein, partial [Deltaproteobacteria bacterium]|nr:HD domain-containing protein [Deltaproteobacteria bacterium]
LQPVAGLVENQSVEACYLVLDKSLQTTKTGTTYLALVLGDKTGRLPGRVWEEAARFDPLFEAGDVIQVRGRVVVYKGQKQINVIELTPLAPEEVDLALFLPAAARPVEEMAAELRRISETLAPPFKDLCQALLADEEFMARFTQAPAAKSVHHAHLGGLLEHTLSVVRMAEEVAGHYPFLHRDLLVTGAILHDAGKAYELAFRPGPAYTDQGRLIGHIVLGEEVLRRHLPQGFPPPLADEISHLILSHHGLQEFGSPKPPQTLEAIALNLIDDLDAKLNAIKDLLEQTEGDWTEYHRLFERYFFRGSPDRPPAEGQPQPRAGKPKSRRPRPPDPNLFE